MSTSEGPTLPTLEFHPVTPKRWRDLERLFGEQGAHGGCWCMWWRLKRSDFAKQTGEQNKRGLKAIVDSGEATGLLAYADGEPIAWCSIGPRERFTGLERSRRLKRVDDQPVWSIVCFFVAKPFRGRGLMGRFLKAALDYAKEHGAKIIEGYPIEPTGRLTGYSGYTGVVSSFRKAGFMEVLRRSDHQPIMRYFAE